MTKKIKVLTLGDHPLLPSGVGIQSKYIIESLLKSGKFEVISLGGAVQHENYEPKHVKQYGEDWTIFPVDGYGDPDRIRSLLRYEKPDILWYGITIHIHFLIKTGMIQLMLSLRFQR